MKNKIVGIILTSMICLCCMKDVLYAKEIPDELKNLYAQSAVLMDADSGRILFGKNEEDVMPMASTTKIMTCILALENMQNSQVCTVSDYAEGQPKVHLGVRSGEQYYLKDLLYSLMLESHNDSAVIIAETIAGSVEAFAELMNEKAMALGCTNTYFITPNGLDAKNENGMHSTTSAELALIMRYCIQESNKKEEFLNITRTNTYQFKDISGNRKFICHNHNAFLGMMEGALSGKTGFTNQAGYCYVGALRRGERTFIVVLLACGWPNNKGYKWKDTRKLMTYALGNYEYQNIENIEMKEILINDCFDWETPFENKIYVLPRTLNPSGKVNVLVGNNEQVEIKCVYEQNVKAPVYKNEKIGTVYYMLGDYIVKSYDIVLGRELEERTIEKCLMVIACRFFMGIEG